MASPTPEGSHLLDEVEEIQMGMLECIIIFNIHVLFVVRCV